jgi:ABC-type multidrug transport system ATPase subunit
MSEPLLKTILQLFAIVAKEDDINAEERNQIRLFLEHHLSKSAVETYLKLFDKYVNDIPSHQDESSQLKSLMALCDEVTPELTQKQKVVILLAVLNIVQADENVSPREAFLIDAIGKSFKIGSSEVDAIKTFVVGNTPTDLDHLQILIIDNQAPANFTNAKHIYREHLDGFAAVLYLDKSEIFFIKYLGGSDVFFNGVPIKRGVIEVLAVGSMLRWEKDPPVYYGDLLIQFKKFSNQTRLTFEGVNLSYKFKNGRLGLRDIHLAEESGNLVARLGASGAGKSTLLHVLNGTEKPSGGQVLINGIDIHKYPKKVEGVIGFVPQDDLLVDDLTVFQNLYYAAKLCFSNKTEDEIQRLVMKVLEDLGLEETKDLRVGSPLQKTISGGQRKRLNIGLELLREPAVLFCDEPTSGLSSRDSENIIDLLKELSLKGKLVFAVIHQPSSDIFKMFDKLLILDTGGFQIYYGNPVDAVVYFKRSINLVNSDEGECHECRNVNPEQIFNIIETKVINEYGHFTNERKISSEQWNAMFKAQQTQSQLVPAESMPPSSLKIPSRIKQTHLFSLRDIQAKIHNRQYMVINLLEAPLLAFILAFIVRYFNEDEGVDVGYVLAKNLNIPAYLFMSVIVALFMGLTVSAEEIIRDRKILKREAFLHLSRSSYLFSKMSILFILSAIQTCLFVLVGNYILQIEGLFFEHWFILFATSCFANMLGLNISSAFNSAVTIYILIPLLIIPQLILSGVVVKFDKLNPIIGNTATVPLVGDLMASRWAFEASMVTQFKDNKFEKDYYAYEKVMANSDYKRVYYIPELHTRLQYILNNFKSTDAEVQQVVSENIALLGNEIKEEIEQTGLPFDLDLINKQPFDSTTYGKVLVYLDEMKSYYIKRFNRADQAKEGKINKLTRTPEDALAFAQHREKHHNEAVAELVKNFSEKNRIIEKDGRLIQKVYPIYKTPDPTSKIDFKAQFYMPQKHFLSYDIDTFWFNTVVIWSMSLFLFVMLYFDVLRKIISLAENISSPFPKRM